MKLFMLLEVLHLKEGEKALVEIEVVPDRVEIAIEEDQAHEMRDLKDLAENEDQGQLLAAKDQKGQKDLAENEDHGQLLEATGLKDQKGLEDQEQLQREEKENLLKDLDSRDKLWQFSL